MSECKCRVGRQWWQCRGCGEVWFVAWGPQYIDGSPITYKCTCGASMHVKVQTFQRVWVPA